MNDVGVYQDSADSDEGLLQPSYVNIASQLLLTNENGDNLTTADVATLDTANDESAVEADSSGPYRPAFVVPEDIKLDMDGRTKTIADAAAGWMFKPGSFVPDAAVDGAVTRGEYLTYSPTVKKFTGTDAFIRRPLKAQAIALASIAAAGNIPVLLLSPSPGICRRARVYNDADIDFPSAAFTAVTFNSEVYDAWGMHSTASNTSRLTIPSDQYGTALYHISAQLTWAAAGTRYILIKVNGTTYIAANYTPTACLGVRVETTYPLDAGDYVEVVVFPTAGADVKYYEKYSPTFSIMQVGE